MTLLGGGQVVVIHIMELSEFLFISTLVSFSFLALEHLLVFLVFLFCLFPSSFLLCF